MKTEDITTPEYAAALWKANHERNKLIEEKRRRMQELDDIALIEDGFYSEE